VAPGSSFALHEIAAQHGFQLSDAENRWRTFGTSEAFRRARLVADIGGQNLVRGQSLEDSPGCGNRENPDRKSSNSGHESPYS